MNTEELLKAIRRKCVYCCGGIQKLAAECNSEECPLWVYRPEYAQKSRERAKGSVQISMFRIEKGGQN